MKNIKDFENFVNEELTAKQKKLPQALQDAISKKQSKKKKSDEKSSYECDDKKIKKSAKKKK